MFCQITKILVALSFAICCFSQQEERSNSSLPDVDLSKFFNEPTLVSEPKPVAKTPAKAPKAQKPAMIYRMGLQYRVTLCTQQCDIREVDTSREFYSGDRIRFSFNANTDGYLYVLHRGSTGGENLLFPDPRLNGGSNRIKKNVQYPVPPDTWFVFDENPGEEFLRVILSRHPLESLPQEVKKQPPFPQSGKDPGLLLQLISAVDQELSRKVNTRDLALFTEQSPLTSDGTSSVQSTIVVNTNSSADKNEIVYKDIVLKHTSAPIAAQYKDMSARDLFVEGLKKTIQPGSAKTAAPLGLSYSVLKQQENGQFMKVDPQGNFYSGDSIRLRVEVNDSGYLYIIHRGPDGIWQPLFPSADASKRSNAVQKNEIYEIPAAGDKYRWVFDDQPGLERLFIVFSRQQKPGFDVLLKSIADEPGAQPAKSSSKMASDTSNVDDGSLQLVNDNFVAQMNERYMRGRGIKQEIVHEKESTALFVPVAYVADPSGTSDSLVVAEVSLTHK